jgi:uncharacterized protein YbbC (DUF1343 family)
MMLKFGLDVFLHHSGEYKSQRLALVTNHAAVTSDYRPARQALLSAGYRIARLFSPEHGLETIGADGSSMPDGIDRWTGLPVISLYGSRLQPEAEQLADIDTVIFDLPNIGCRFYTYLWTLTYVMDACRQYGKKLLVLDRPNLISGNLDLAEGPFLDEERCASFVGRWRIPTRHSCTIAELASFWTASRMPGLCLDVVPVEGWNRNSFPCDWSTSFVPTSPAIVDPEAALLYPGLGLLEATNLSEGRGTAVPFRVVGAPWLNAIALADRFNSMKFPGIVARAVTFTPESSKYRGLACNGVMLHITDRASFRPVLSAAVLIKLARDNHRTDFAWARYPTSVNPTGAGHLDKLLGIAGAESIFDDSLPHLLERLQTLLDCNSWKNTIQPFLLY